MTTHQLDLDVDRVPQDLLVMECNARLWNCHVIEIPASQVYTTRNRKIETEGLQVKILIL